MLEARQAAAAAAPSSPRQATGAAAGAPGAAAATAPADATAGVIVEGALANSANGALTRLGGDRDTLECAVAAMSCVIINAVEVSVEAGVRGVQHRPHTCTPPGAWRLTFTPH